MSFNLFQVVIITFLLNSIFLLFLLRRISNLDKKLAFLIGVFIILFNLEKFSLFVLPSIQREIEFVLPHIPVLFFLPAVFFLLLLKVLFPERQIRSNYAWVWLPGVLDVLYSIGSWWYISISPHDAPFHNFITGRLGFFLHQAAAIIYSFLLLVLLLVRIKWAQIRFIESAKFLKFLFIGVSILILRWFLLISLNVFIESYSTNAIERGFTIFELAFFMYIGVRVLITPRILKIKYSGFQVPDTEILKKQANVLAQKILEQKLYLKPDVSRKQLADAIQSSEAHVSAVLLKGIGVTFYQFINQLRVKEAIKHINDGKLQSWSIESLAKEVGFKSKTTFYKLFKEETGLTPLEYARREERI